MRSVLKHFLLSLLLTPLFLFAQNTEEELLKWSASRRLSWSDYKAKPNPNSDAAATTTTVLAVDYNFNNNQFGFTIKSQFSKTRSWGVHKTDYILSHEQGHFDIAEVFARKLHKNLSEYRFNKKTYQKDLKKIYSDITEEKEEVQNNYDKETSHSINKEKQAEWLKKISAMLEEYSAWADY
jgi:hypothetical protein